MTTLAPFARPPHAVTIWADDSAIFVELPFKAGAPPYIMRFPHSEGGLSKALNILRQAHEEARSPAPTNYTRHPAIRRVPINATTAPCTEAQREAARDVLRKITGAGVPIG